MRFDSFCCFSIHALASSLFLQNLLRPEKIKSSFSLVNSCTWNGKSILPVSAISYFLSCKACGSSFCINPSSCFCSAGVKSVCSSRYGKKFSLYFVICSIFSSSTPSCSQYCLYIQSEDKQ